MTMLTQVAVGLAAELNLHGNIPRRIHLRSDIAKQPQRQHQCTFEESRAVLALYCLTSL